MDINSREGYPITSYTFENTRLPDKPDGFFTGSPNYCFSLYGYEAPRIKWIDKYGFQRYALIIRLNYINRYEDREETNYFDVIFQNQSKILITDQEPGSILHIFEGDDFLRKIGSGVPTGKNCSEGVCARSLLAGFTG
ncbi:MAG: hypothetical protein NTV01_15065 [Bacteroidia bacterium]|nr:hypothetical protein [Bacteroidia bacterium]